MKITILCVGKIKEKFYRDAIAEYSKRLSRYCKLDIIEVADEKTPENASDTVENQIREKEAERILTRLDKEAKKGAMDALLGKEVDYTIEGAETIKKAPESTGTSYNIEAQANQEIKFAYCTQFLIMLDTPITLQQENEFKSYLETIGDSIVVVADDEIVKVHVHTNDPGLAMQRNRREY